MATKKVDVMVIGGGPGGYVAAIRAAQLGLSVLCVDKRETLGGTCLNVGCIPSKALLNSSEKYHEARHSFSSHGVKVGEVSLDLSTLMGRKNQIVADLTKGIAFLFKKNKVQHLSGVGTLKGSGMVSIALTAGGEETWEASHIILATGSESTPLPGVAIDEDRIVSSTGALAFPEVPQHLVVIGAGYIGLEMGSVWSRLGSKVTVLEYLPHILPMMDQEVAKALEKSLTDQGMIFQLGTKVTGAVSTQKDVTLSLASATGSDTSTLVCDRVLVSIGRRPYTQGLGLEAAGIQLDERGRIKVNHQYQTNVAGVYAIGDVIPGPMLAHKAEEEGVAVAEFIGGQRGHVNYDTIPAVVYTNPEVASVGKTEEELKASGVSYKVGKFPFSANSRGRVYGSGSGFVKILAHAQSDEILGAHIIGPEAGHLIGELVLAMEYKAASEDVARTCHAHPTLSEAIKEAALAVLGRAIHT
jgi:dihydrolipoamide dehydrogenase